MRFAVLLIALAACSTPAPPVKTPVTPPPTTAVTEVPIEEDHACGAYEESGDDDADVGYFVSNREATWEPGTTLVVGFLDGKPEWRAKVAELASEWTRYGNIKFVFDPPADAQDKPAIRISFKETGYWSVIGSGSLRRAADRPTMNFHFTLMSKSEKEMRRVVVHEFGHALGLHHEQQNPNLKVTWNKDYIYAYYLRTQGWDKAKVDINVLTPLSLERVSAKPFDPKSIMLYPFLPEFTVEKIATERPMVPSEDDKKWFGELYPGLEKPATPDDTMAAAKKVKFAYAQVGDKRWSAAVDAPADVLAKIERVMYQRQADTFSEFKTGTFFHGKGEADRFAFEWTGTSIVKVKMRIVWKSGIVTAATYDKKPADLRPKKTDWKAVRNGVTFAFTSKALDDKWSSFAVAISSARTLPHVATVEYQRQHESFPELASGKNPASNLASNKFGIAWRGYGWVSVKAIVHFKDGSTQEYAIAPPS